MGTYGLGNTMRKCKQDFIFLNPANKRCGKHFITITVLYFILCYYYCREKKVLYLVSLLIKNFLTARHTDYKKILLFLRKKHLRGSRRRMSRRGVREWQRTKRL